MDLSCGSVVVVNMWRIKCCTLSLVVKKEGKLYSTCSARTLACESLDTKMASIRYKNISLDERGNICCIFWLHRQKTKVAIRLRSLFVELLNTSAS